MLYPNTSRPISSHENRTSGARIRRPVSSTEQRRGAVVGVGRKAGDQRRGRAGLRQRDRGRQSRRAAADDDDVVGIGAGWCRCIVHIGTIDVPGGIFKPASPSRIAIKLRGGTPQPRMYKSRRFLIALLAK
jgi:hypothetical protein